MSAWHCTQYESFMSTLASMNLPSAVRAFDGSKYFSPSFDSSRPAARGS